ncbi:MAG TPA: hypothetical protein VMB78_07270 [Dissulfurispiraceae bacterium]|nr:hypothetical protein [Dissulfurispiraceae bacterium]
MCGNKIPCFASIQSGIGAVQSSTIMEITQEIYNEQVNFNKLEGITLRGGWDTSFTSNPSYTTISGSINITQGTITIQNIILK